MKNKDANKFVSTGVFRICRHPAYFAEVPHPSPSLGIQIENLP